VRPLVLNLGDVQVRGGVVDRVDLGFRVVRSPGQSYRSYAGAHAKVDLVPDELSVCRDTTSTLEGA
jgi:hypothetical protein